MPELASVRDLLLTAIRYHEAEIAFPAPLPVQAVCVRDSDTLDRLGFTGIPMTLQYGVWIGRPLCHPADPLMPRTPPDLSGFTMDYVRYLESLPECLMTTLARSNSEEKQKQHEFYCSEFLSSFRQGRMCDPQDALQLVRVHMEEKSRVGESACLAVPVKWRKYLALVDFGFQSADELASEIRRYPKSKVHRLVSDINSDIRRDSRRVRRSLTW